MFVVFVFRAGLQRADRSPRRHHCPHRVLLLRKLCARGNPGDARTRLLRLPAGGKPLTGFSDWLLSAHPL